VAFRDASGTCNGMLGLSSSMRGAAQRVKGRWFYRAMGIVAVLLVIAAFTPGVVHSAGRNAPLTPLVWVHGAVFSAWLLLYLVQTTLIAARCTAVHRRIGVAATVLAAAVLGVGYATAVAMARRGFDLSGDLNAAADPLRVLVLPLGDLVSFGVLVTGAFWYRRRPEVHARLMLLATAGALMAAPLAHLIAKIPALREAPPVILVPLSALCMASAVHDRIVDGRIHPVSLWGGVALLAWGPLRALVIGPSATWHLFAGWLIR
jgi:hypothetical protein